MQIIDINEYQSIEISQCINNIIYADCLNFMRLLPDKSIDMVVTSPPYNLLNSSGNGFKPHNDKSRWKNAKIKQGYANCQDNMPYSEYIEWQKRVLKECFRLLKDDGAIFYNNKNRVQKGILENRVKILEDLPLRQIVTWQRSGGMNFNDGYYLPTTEQIYIIAKKEFKLIKGANKYTDVWKISQARNNPHPAPFPQELTDRILSSTNKKLILDPFGGSGTTALSCLKYNRNFIIVDNAFEYCSMALKRISAYKPVNIFEWVKTFRKRA